MAWNNSADTLLIVKKGIQSENLRNDKIRREKEKIREEKERVEREMWRKRVWANTPPMVAFSKRRLLLSKLFCDRNLFDDCVDLVLSFIKPCAASYPCGSNIRLSWGLSPVWMESPYNKPCSSEPHYFDNYSFKLLEKTNYSFRISFDGGSYICGLDMKPFNIPIVALVFPLDSFDKFKVLLEYCFPPPTASFERIFLRRFPFMHPGNDNFKMRQLHEIIYSLYFKDISRITKGYVENKITYGDSGDYELAQALHKQAFCNNRNEELTEIEFEIHKNYVKEKLNQVLIHHYSCCLLARRRELVNIIKICATLD